VYYSLFKDKETQNIFFEWGEFENLDGEELSSIILAYNGGLEPFQELNIKYAALSGTIQNFLSFSDNPYYLFGKAIVGMTFFQSSLISYATYYKYIMENVNNLPDDIKTDPIKLEDSFTASRNLNSSINRSGGASEEKERVGSEIVSVFGASEQDLKDMGLINANEQQGQLHEKLREKGEMDFLDILKLPEFRN